MRSSERGLIPAVTDDAPDTRRRGRLARWTVLIALVMSSATVGLADAYLGEPTPSPANEGCAEPGDRPEEGAQGSSSVGEEYAFGAGGFNCGVDIVAHVPDAGGAMAAAGDCAYTGGGGADDPEVTRSGGVRVIDVSDRAQPFVARVLNTGSRELLAAHEYDQYGISLLATRHRVTEARDGQVLGRDMEVDVWDITEDCANPKLIDTITIPTTSDVFGDPPAEVGGPAHNLKFHPTRLKLYGSLPIHEIDLSVLGLIPRRSWPEPGRWPAWPVKNRHCEISEQVYALHTVGEPIALCDGLTELESPMGAAGGLPAIDHEPTFSPDGTRLYIGGQLPAPTNSNDLLVIDIEDDRSWKVVGAAPQSPGHSIDYMTIDGVPHLLHSNEITATGCLAPEELRPTWLGWADRAYILSLADETAPRRVAEVRLNASRFEECGPTFGGPSTAYHDVDDVHDTHFAVIGFTSAGHRIFDVTEPSNPTEIAYFNHGESAHTKSYVQDNGDIWASNENGFFVIRLKDSIYESRWGMEAPRP